MTTIQKLKKLFDLEAYITLLSYAKGYKIAIIKLTIISTIISAIGIYLAVATKNLIDFAINGDYSAAIRSGLLFALLIIIQIAFDSYLSYADLQINIALKNQLQLKFLDNIYHKNWLEVSRYNTGDLSTRLYNDINLIVNSITYTIPTIIALFIQVVMGFIFLAYYDITLALLTFTVTPLSIILSMLLGFKLKKIQKDIQETESSHRSTTNESFSNLTILKTFNYTRNRLKEIQKLQDKKKYFLNKKNRIKIIADIILSIGYSLGFFAALAIGAFRLSTGAISFGTLTAFIQLVSNVQTPLHYMAQEIPSLVASFSSVERFEELKRISDENKSIETVDKNLIPNRVSINNITFAYNDDHPVLNNISLDIFSGSKIAIIGSSGEGKTTLINILLALIPIHQGHISLSFSDTEDVILTSEYRHLFSYVSQTNMLFTGTIRENFLLTKEHSEFEIKQALHASCCNDFIDQLALGLETPLLEDGLGLSQGQLQRISIARALIHNRPILIFDEATSSLDPHTEELLISNIKKYYSKTTLIAITHRQGILSICDEVYRLTNHQLKKEL